MANYPKVKVLRAKKREGLIRARLLGAHAATGESLEKFDLNAEFFNENFSFKPLF